MMIKLKRIVFIIVWIVVIVVIGMNYEKIYSRINEFFTNKREPVIKDSNIYERNYDYMFVKDVSYFEPDSYTDLVNIYYTVLNNGWDEFTFYCSEDYDDCLDDVGKLSNDNDLLSNINDFINPYNSYKAIKTSYDESGEITVKVTHLYNSKEIKDIETELDRIIQENVNDKMDNREKIKVLHDYIVNNTKYDSKKANEDDSPYDSARINGVLFDHYGICSGYADTMAVILDKLEIPNFKVSSSNHVWNAVYLDNKWYHLDLTWDDPVTTTGKDLLEHSYFLISTEELRNQDLKNNNSNDDQNNHYFDENIYLEFKTN